MDDGRAEDGPFQLALAERLLGVVFGSVVETGGVGAGAKGGHVNESLDICQFGGMDKG